MFQAINQNYAAMRDFVPRKKNVQRNRTMRTLKNMMQKNFIGKVKMEQMISALIV